MCCAALLIGGTILDLHPSICAHVRYLCAVVRYAFFCWLSCQATGLYIKSLRVLDWGMVEYIFSIYKFALNDGEIR